MSSIGKSHGNREPAGTWCRNSDGQKSDPVTLRVQGSLAAIERALEAAGWTKANPGTFRNDVAYVGAATREELQRGVAKLEKLADHFLPSGLLPTLHPEVPAVQKMPFSSQFLHGKPFIAGYQKNNEPLGGRDHMTIFRVGPGAFDIAPSADSGITLRLRSANHGFLDHSVVPDTAPERDKVLADLVGQGARILDERDERFGVGAAYGEKVSDSKTYDLAMPGDES